MLILDGLPTPDDKDAPTAKQQTKQVPLSLHELQAMGVQFMNEDSCRP